VKVVLFDSAKAAEQLMDSILFARKIFIEINQECNPNPVYRAIWQDVHTFQIGYFQPVVHQPLPDFNCLSLLKTNG
jgi:hypothetical protein